MSADHNTPLKFEIVPDKNVTPRELARLLIAVGWEPGGDENDPQLLGCTEQAIEGSTFVVHARDEEGELIGYASALSNGVYTTFIDMVLVDPAVQRRGIGRALLQAVEEKFRGVPMYAMPFVDMHELFIKMGYKIQKKRPMQALSKRNPFPQPTMSAAAVTCA